MPYNALRKGRYSQPSGEYLVTFVVMRRAPVFRDARAARMFIEELEASRVFADARWHAWVLMPDHFHGLLSPGDQCTLASLVAHIKGRSARRINAYRGTRGALWQPAFHDHALRRDENRRAIVRYILDNPVRAGLVEHRSGYPYWACEWIASRDEDI